MGDKTSIEWTDATWNPITGCTKVSVGCDHCYAEGIATRFAGSSAYPDGFKVTLRPDRLDQPLRWQKPRRIFVNSMSDLFHDDVPDNFIGSVFDTMARASQHTYQILTKRPGRARSLLNKWQKAAQDRPHAAASFRRHDMLWCEPGVWPLPNVWLGVSVENQKWADVRIPTLLETPAAVRFLSMEPLLGQVWFTGSHCPEHDFPGGFCTFSCPLRQKIDWIIVGGESGGGARPMHPDWLRSIRDQCQDMNIPFFFKQWGNWTPAHWKGEGGATHAWSGKYFQKLSHSPTSSRRNQSVPNGAQGMVRVSKCEAGRDLDGRTWEEFPEVINA